MAILTVPVRWLRSQLAETVASDRASAARYRGSKNIGVMTIVVTKFELGHVQRQVFLADLVEGAYNAALHERPKALNRICVNRADHVFALAWSTTPCGYSLPRYL
jgi:hypothetical protein